MPNGYSRSPRLLKGALVELSRAVPRARPERDRLPVQPGDADAEAEPVDAAWDGRGRDENGRVRGHRGPVERAAVRPGESFTLSARARRERRDGGAGASIRWVQGSGVAERIAALENAPISGRQPRLLGDVISLRLGGDAEVVPRGSCAGRPLRLGPGAHRARPPHELQRRGAGVLADALSDPGEGEGRPAGAHRRSFTGAGRGARRRGEASPSRPTTTRAAEGGAGPGQRRQQRRIHPSACCRSRRRACSSRTAATQGSRTYRVLDRRGREVAVVHAEPPSRGAPLGIHLLRQGAAARPPAAPLPGRPGRVLADLRARPTRCCRTRSREAREIAIPRPEA